MFKHGSQLLAIVLLLLLFVIPATANSTSYSIFGTLTSLNGLNQQQLSGSVTWDSSLGATSSSFSLSNTVSSQFCSSACTLLFATFQGTGKWAGDREVLIATLGPSLNAFVLTIYSSSGRLLQTYKGNGSWAVPERGSPLDLLLVFAVLIVAAVMSTRRRAPKQI